MKNPHEELYNAETDYLRVLRAAVRARESGAVSLNYEIETVRPAERALDHARIAVIAARRFWAALSVGEKHEAWISSMAPTSGLSNI